MRPSKGLVPLAVAGASLILLLLVPAGSAYGERIFAANVASTNNAYTVSASARAAQSFTPTTSMILYNVTLRVQNAGVKSDYLNVTIESDAGGVPSGTVLAGSNRSQQGSNWLDLPMNPRPLLLAGTQYWIVAANVMAPGDGYDWFHANADTVPGQGMQDFGAGWTVSIVTDLTYLTFGIAAGTQIAVGISTNPATPGPGNSLSYTVALNNTGWTDARMAWVNLTLPSQVAYVSDDAATVGGVKTGMSSWTFANVVNGPHTFEVVLTVTPETPVGTIVSATVHLDYADAGGVMGLPSSATASFVVGLPPGPTPGNNPASLLGLLAVALAVPPAGYLVWRRRKPAVEELFLVHNHGLLLCHLSRRLRAQEDKDDDILGAMLTVVQDFVRDSFRYGKDRELDRIEFGTYRVLIERGSYVYLAAAFSGKDSPELRRRLRRTIHQVEAAYGKDLERFDGKMEPLLGVRDVVAGLVRKA